MNKNTKTVDRMNKTITVSKDFLKKAGQFGTPEFFEALQMKKDFPGYTLVQREIKRNPDKQTYGRLTYDRMRVFISGFDKERLAEFENIQKWAKTQTASYVQVKKWFLDHYEEEFKKDCAKQEAEKAAREAAKKAAKENEEI